MKLLLPSCSKERGWFERCKIMPFLSFDLVQASFENEWKELGKLIESDRKMKELLRQRDKAGIGPNGKLDDEDRLRKKIMRGNAAISKDKAAQQAALQKVQSYEEAFAKIQESTGISDIDELVRSRDV